MDLRLKTMDLGTGNWDLGLAIMKLEVGTLDYGIETWDYGTWDKVIRT